MLAVGYQQQLYTGTTVLLKLGAGVRHSLEPQDIIRRGTWCQPPSLPPFPGDLPSDVEDEGAEAQGLVPKAVLRRWC